MSANSNTRTLILQSHYNNNNNKSNKKTILVLYGPRGLRLEVKKPARARQWLRLLVIKMLGYRGDIQFFLMDGKNTHISVYLVICAV